MAKELVNNYYLQLLEKTLFSKKGMHKKMADKLKAY